MRSWGGESLGGKAWPALGRPRLSPLPGRDQSLRRKHRSGVHWVRLRLGLQKTPERAEDFNADVMWGLFGEVDHTAAGPLKRSPWDGACAGQ